MKILVSVTSKHIKLGRKLGKQIMNGQIPGFYSQYCPVALALTDAGLGRFSVFGVRCSNSEGNTFILPRSVSRFVSRFDDKKVVKPFRFYFTKEAQ